MHCPLWLGRLLYLDQPSARKIVYNHTNFPAFSVIFAGQLMPVTDLSRPSVLIIAGPWMLWYPQILPRKFQSDTARLDLC